MRSRAAVFFILALLLGALPFYLRGQAQANCARTSESDDSGPIAAFFSTGSDTPTSCVDVTATLPPWARGAGVLSAVCAACSLLIAGRAMYDQRREAEIVRSVRQMEERGRR